VTRPAAGLAALFPEHARVIQRLRSELVAHRAPHERRWA
jgi:hypothetical protein